MKQINVDGQSLIYKCRVVTGVEQINWTTQSIITSEVGDIGYMYVTKYRVVTRNKTSCLPTINNLRELEKSRPATSAIHEGMWEVIWEW